jgi:pimeloyl-ACP methyl ester carboxylesterase
LKVRPTAILYGDRKQESGFFESGSGAVDFPAQAPYNLEKESNMNVRNRLFFFAVLTLVLLAAAAISSQGGPKPVNIERKTCRAADGVTIVYSACGAGEPAFLFVHGGLADRTFWDAELKAFGGQHRVVALDLAGHGESGSNRTRWGMPEFGADVKAVADAEKLKGVIIFGNSLGGPVAIEAALLMPGRVLGVVGVDTFQSLDYKTTPEEAKRRAEAFGSDYAGSVKQMVKMLFHADADPAVMAEAERRMQKTPPAAARAMFLSFAGYDPAAAARKLTAPLRAINGDLYPTDVAGVRKVKADFDVIVMKHMGHYPMLERPGEFNTHVATVVAELSKGKPGK